MSAYLLKNIGKILIVVALILAAIGFFIVFPISKAPVATPGTSLQPVPASSPKGVQPTVLEQQVLFTLISDRVSAGEIPLVQDKTLDDIAKARAWYILTHHYMSHCSENTAAPDCHLQLADQVLWRGLPKIEYAENLALAPFPDTDGAGVNKLFMDSEGHRTNIQNAKYKKVGVGVMCCFEGVAGNIIIPPDQTQTIYVEIFSE